MKGFPKQKCEYCGKPYIHFDLHWGICTANPDFNKDLEDEVEDGIEDLTTTTNGREDTNE